MTRGAVVIRWFGRFQLRVVRGLNRGLASQRERLWAPLHGYRFNGGCVDFGGIAGRPVTVIGAPQHSFVVGPVTLRSPNRAVISDVSRPWGLRFEPLLDVFVDVDGTQRITLEIEFDGGQGLGIRSLADNGAEIVRKRVATINQRTRVVFDRAELAHPIAHLQFFADDTVDSPSLYTLCIE